MEKFIVRGNQPLSGKVKISGSKNAVLPIIASTVLFAGNVVLQNVPQISDVDTMLKVIKDLGGDFKWNSDSEVEINTKNINKTDVLNKDLTKMRGTILFLSSMISRFKKIALNYPGGCVLGKRPIAGHLFVMEKLGAKINLENDIIYANTKKLVGKTFIMPEFSVTTTENAIIGACMAEGESIIKLVASEPHVQDLCLFLNKAGAKIEGIGTHTLKIKGVKKLNSIKYSITPDYLEAGTMILAGVLLKSNILVDKLDPEALDMFFNRLEFVNANFKVYKDKVEVLKPKKKYKALDRLESRIFPGFPTDLQAPFSVLLTQCEGVSKIFETMFENRLGHLFELEKMGAKVEMLNPHQAIVIGKTKLRGMPVSSLDIRAGTAMVLAGLVAEGDTEISNIHYIDRGYFQLEEKLKKLGANIKRISIKQ